MTDTPVLIAGGGASGTVQALLLAQQGVASIVLEARSEAYPSPRAHALNPRSLEICRAMGLDMGRMHREAAPASQASSVFFLPRLIAPVLGVLPYERQDLGALDFTPTPLINLPQTEFETMLFEAADVSPLITYRRNARWKDVVRRGQDLISTVDTPDGAIEISSRYLIGCDGAGSSVRNHLGFEMTGDAGLLSCLSIVFKADLTQRLADRQGMLFWTTDPAARGIFLGYHMDRLWSFIQMHPPGRIDMSLHTPERCREIVVNAIGEDIEDLEILHALPWTMTSQVAARYADDGIFLVGDAAHRFPPTGGLGLNTGIQDAHNLAWKIAMVVSGQASEKLLDSYEKERRPVALKNADQSLRNAKMLEKLVALDCPESIWRDAASMDAWLTTDRKELVGEAVEAQREHFDSFGLQLGFSYPPSKSEVEQPSVYVPKVEPGHRLPHDWLEDGSKRSIIDLLSPTRFTLICGPDAQPDSSVTTNPSIELLRVKDIRASARWHVLAQLDAADAILIRPDGHIAWRGLASQAGAAFDAYVMSSNLQVSEPTSDT